ncbi:MAG: DUF1194 domain-containing protein [Methyloligellaceae bacterium]
MRFNPEALAQCGGLSSRSCDKAGDLPSVRVAATAAGADTIVGRARQASAICDNLIDATGRVGVVSDSLDGPCHRAGGAMLRELKQYARGRRCARGWCSSWALMAIVCVAVTAVSSPVARAARPVDLVLVLALDVSSSVDAREFDIQKTGLVQAFRHASVLRAIRRGRYKRIAVTAVQWAGYEQQQIMVPWTVVGDETAALVFAAQLAAMPRAYPHGATHISGIIAFAAKLAFSAPYAAVRRVIDISGDGIDNVKGQPRDARDAALGVGMTINGLAIANETPDLVDYYRAQVIGGPSAFVLDVRNYQAYPRAILRKLVREI